MNRLNLCQLLFKSPLVYCIVKNEWRLGKRISGIGKCCGANIYVKLAGDSSSVYRQLERIVEESIVDFLKTYPLIRIIQTDHPEI